MRTLLATLAIAAAFGVGHLTGTVATMNSIPTCDGIMVTANECLSADDAPLSYDALRQHRDELGYELDWFAARTMVEGDAIRVDCDSEYVLCDDEGA